MKSISENFLVLSVAGFAFFIPLSKFAVSLFFVLTLLLFFTNPDKFRSLKKILISRYLIAIAVYLLLHIIGLLWADNLPLGFTYLQKMLFLLLVPLIAISLKKKEREYVLYSFITGVLVSMLISYMILFFDLQFLKQHSAFGPVPFLDHRHYSVLIGIAAAILLIIFLEREWTKKYKIMFIAAEVLLIISLLLSGGRVGVIVLFSLSVYSAVVYWKKLKSKALVFPLTILALVYILYFIGGGFKYRANLAYKGIEKALAEHDYNSSWGGRIALAEVGFELIKDNPLAGVGTGDVENELKDKMKEEFPEFLTTGKLNEAADLHNQFFQDFVMLGLPGIFSLIFVFYSIFRMKIEDVIFSRIKFILLISFMLFGFTEIVLHSMIPLVTFVLLSSLLLAEEMER